MPVNKDALRRYRVIDRMLSDPNHTYTTNDIMARVNKECGEEKKVELRMIQKDIKALEEEFGKKMVRNAGRRGTVKYENQAEPLFYQELTWEEEEVLREVLRSLGQFDGLDNFTWLDLLKKKLEMTDSSNSIPYISFSKNEGLQIPDKLLGSLFMAISRKAVIEVLYKPFGKQPYAIKVHPYQLKQYNDRWFLLCCPSGTKEKPFNPEYILNLALDRMSGDFKYVDDEIYVECAVNLKERFDEIIGVTLKQENDVEDIYFAVDNKSLEYVRTKWMHSSQIELNKETQKYFRQKYPSLNHMTFFSIECRENQELYTRFASYIGNIVLVEPVYMREKLQNYLVEAIGNYNNL
jgi:predicted DNA-binding transcriptional regulator YafY